MKKKRRKRKREKEKERGRKYKNNVEKKQVNHHSSSSSCLPCIALCRARNASASPPARLAFEALFGVARPLPPESCEFILTALSRGAGGGAGFLPAIFGRLAGGAGGAGLALAAAAVAAPLMEGTGLALAAAGGGGGGAGLGVGAACSSRYAWGVQPWTEVVMFIHNHQPRSISFVVLVAMESRTYHFLPSIQSVQFRPPECPTRWTGRC
jgi:hypothetical protein